MSYPTESIKTCSYFIWEYVGHNNALNDWYCAEDIACFFEKYSILSTQNINAIKALGTNHDGYINFVRNISYRLYFFSRREDRLLNWLSAENLINNGEWCEATLYIANFYKNNKFMSGFKNDIRSAYVKSHYNTFK